MITEIEKIDNKIFGYTSLIFTLFIYIAYVALINLKVFHDGFLEL